MPGSAVITGGGRGVGAATARALIARGLEVVVLDTEAPDWTHDRLTAVLGDASDPADVARAADAAVALQPLVGWVNNAEVSEGALLHEHPEAVLETIAANLVPAVVGTAEAVRRFLAVGSRGAIVNVSSQQAQRPMVGAMPKAVTSAAVEGLTRATAVDYGSRGIRANAVALGPVSEPGGAAEAIAWLLSNPASFVNGAVLPVEGDRSA